MRIILDATDTKIILKALGYKHRSMRAKRESFLQFAKPTKQKIAEFDAQISECLMLFNSLKQQTNLEIEIEEIL